MQLELAHKWFGDPKILRSPEAQRKSLDNLDIPLIQKNLIYAKQKFTTKSSHALKLKSGRQQIGYKN